MNLVEFTTNTYEITLTSSSLNTTSGLVSGTGTYTYTSVISDSKSYWTYKLIDSKSYSSSTEELIDTKRDIVNNISTSIESWMTKSTSSSTYTAYKGKTYQLESETDMKSIKLESLKFSHTGIDTTVSVSVYGDYSSSYTTFSNKGREDTFISWTVNSTWLTSGTSNAVTVSRTDFFNEGTTSKSSTSDTEYNIYSGIDMSLVYSEMGSTYNLGSSFYNDSSTSSSTILLTKKSITAFNSSKTGSWEDTITSSLNRPATSISYAAVETVEGMTYSNNKTVRYTTSKNYSSTVNSSTVSYKHISVYPQAITTSVRSATQTFIDEYVYSTNEHTVKSIYLYSLTLSIESVSSTSTCLTYTGSNSHSSAWQKEDSHYFPYSGFVSDNVKMSQSTRETESISDRYDGTGWTRQTIYGRVYYEVSYSYPVYSSGSEMSLFTFYSSTSGSTTTYRSSSFSSTLYKGTYSVSTISLYTTLSNYSLISTETYKTASNKRQRYEKGNSSIYQQTYTSMGYTSSTEGPGQTIWTRTDPLT